MGKDKRISRREFVGATAAAAAALAFPLPALAQDAARVVVLPGETHALTGAARQITSEVGAWIGAVLGRAGDAARASGVGG